MKSTLCMFPVGGHIAIDAKQASSIVEEMKPGHVFPMVCKTNALNLPLDHVEDFLTGKSDVIREAAPIFFVDEGELPARTTIVVMDFT